MKTHQQTGKGAIQEKIKTLLLLPSTHAAIVLLFIATALVFMPGMQPGFKDFLMVVFACVALLPGGVKIDSS